jgi:hypothetical protein
MTIQSLMAKRHHFPRFWMERDTLRRDPKKSCIFPSQSTPQTPKHMGPFSTTPPDEKAR